MNRLKDIWGGQDDMNRVLFLIAVAVFVWSLIEGHGMYGALLAVVVLFLMVSRHGQRIKRFGRLYGTLYFPMPDGGGHRPPVFRDDLPPAIPAHGGSVRAV